MLTGYWTPVEPLLLLLYRTRYILSRKQYPYERGGVLFVVNCARIISYNHLPVDSCVTSL